MSLSKVEINVIRHITEMFMGLAYSLNVEYVNSEEEFNGIRKHQWVARLGGEMVKATVEIVKEGKK